VTVIDRLRCAIYTRKSSEEGLEQKFNSLHAQREACEAYIKSQTHEGWRVVKRHYNDGGLSGGTLERPALKALLADIQARRIDVVVVYKIDRLSRALTDFAKLAELFDAHCVSFVSVTQQFNTTTSMGRLMLNVLLSFAQFEREITGERIRDKIAASKKKGIWMGGFVPLGYDAVERQLVVKEAEAKTVRTLFQLYHKHGTVTAVWNRAQELELRTKQRHRTSGQITGGKAFQRGHIYRVLRNPIYAGWIAHQGAHHEGQHTAIVDRDLWTAVQAQLDTNARRSKVRENAITPGLLVGLLHDEHGRRFTHDHATKGGRRYRYYVINEQPTPATQGQTASRRLPADPIESHVKTSLLNLLASKDEWMNALHTDHLDARQVGQGERAAASLVQSLKNATPAEWIAQLRTLLPRVTIDRAQLRLEVSRTALRAALGLPANPQRKSRLYEKVTPARFIQRGSQLKLIAKPADEFEGGIDEDLIRSLARAHAWWRQLKIGDVHSTDDIVRRENLTPSYVTRILRLAFLAPDIIEAILAGRQPPGTSVRQMTQGKRIPIDWAEQRRLFNFPAR